jgi:GTP-binding protein
VFIDQTSISVQAGSGGAGAVSFRREKYVPKGGPDGGNGGNGGSIILRASRQLSTLLDQRYQRGYRAEDGRPGSSSRRDGRRGKDIIVTLPCGTVVKDDATGEILADLVEDGQEYLAARGGKGGRGNASFATPTQQTPRFAEPGLAGEQRMLLLELKLLADVGLVGLPNVGKSTLISVISAARPKIADYPFTTLEPNLGIVRYGDYESFTVADIPGLIEGAHEGRGLGTQFLRHIERTRVLAILIDCLSDDYARDFSVLRAELASYSAELAAKPFLVALSRCDACVFDEEKEAAAARLAGEAGMPVHRFSSVSREGIDAMLRAVWTLLRSSP